MDFSSMKSKEVKEFVKVLVEQFGINLEIRDAVDRLNYYFFKNKKDKMYLINKEYGTINYDIMHITHIGLYFCESNDNSVRLSIDGAQLFYAKFKDVITKNIFELRDDDVNPWIQGKDIDVTSYSLDGYSSYVLIIHGEDILGSGVIKSKILLNFVPKARRLTEVFV
jgi:NOL1/NOP2/fmu family ribosome biogenesis protein